MSLQNLRSPRTCARIRLGSTRYALHCHLYERSPVHMSANGHWSVVQPVPTSGESSMTEGASIFPTPLSGLSRVSNGLGERSALLHAVLHGSLYYLRSVLALVGTPLIIVKSAQIGIPSVSHSYKIPLLYAATWASYRIHDPAGQPSPFCYMGETQHCCSQPPCSYKRRLHATIGNSMGRRVFISRSNQPYGCTCR